MRKILLVITFFTVVSFSAQDIDFTYNFIGGQKDAQESTLNEWVHELVLRYSGLIPFSDKVGLLISEDFDGITQATEAFPCRAINHPVNSRTTLGLEFTGLGRMQVRGILQGFVNSLENDFPVYFESPTPHKDARMVQRLKRSADFYWDIPINRMNITASLLYNNLLYDYYRFGESKPDQYDSDLWFGGSMVFSVVEDKFKIIARGLGKHDLNNYGGYNLANVSLGIGSDFVLFKRKIKGTGELMPRYYMSTIMDEKGYADQLGITSHVRLFYKLKPRMFLKGDLEYEVAPVSGDQWYVKQRYELAFRNAWKNLSCIEFGGWGTFGTLFPRVCGYAWADIAAAPKFDIIPGIRAYWMWEENWTKTGIGDELTLQSSGYSYYRTDLELMIRYLIGAQNARFFKKFALNCGAEYKVFDWGEVLDPPYVNTLRLFFGMTNYL